MIASILLKTIFEEKINVPNKIQIMSFLRPLLASCKNLEVNWRGEYNTDLALFLRTIKFTYPADAVDEVLREMRSQINTNPIDVSTGICFLAYFFNANQRMLKEAYERLITEWV